MRWVFNATPWPLYPQERPGTHCIGGWVDRRAGLDGCGKSRPLRDSISGPSSPVASRYNHWAIQAPTIFFSVRSIWNAAVDFNVVLNLYFVPRPKEYLPTFNKFLECTGRAEFARPIMCTLSTQNVNYICSPVWATTQIYRGADKSLAGPRRKQATVTEDFYVHISYLLS
jgi:hypothetical protein